MTSIKPAFHESAAVIRHLESAALAVVFSNPAEAIRLVALASLLRPEVRQ